MAQTLDQRIAGVAHLSDDELAKLIRSNEPPVLRQAAVMHLRRPELVIELAQDATKEPLSAVARKRLGELLDSGEATLEQLESRVGDPVVLLEVCEFSSNAAAKLIERITDERVLAQLVKTAATTNLRQAAAAKIEQKEQLRDALKFVRDKDKTAYKIIKTKLDALKAQEALEKTLNEEGEALYQQMLRLAKRELDDVYFAQKTQLMTEWQSRLGAVSSDLAERFSALSDKLATREREYHAHLELQQARLENERILKAELSELADAVQAQTARLFDVGLDATSEQALADLRRRSDDLAAALKTNNLSFPAEEQGLSSRVQNASKLAEALKNSATFASFMHESGSDSDQKTRVKALSGLKHLLRFAQEFAPGSEPECVVRARQILDDASQEQKQLIEAKRRLETKCFEHIRRANHALNQGQVRRAKGVFADLEKSFSQLERPPKVLQAKYEQLQDAMAKLGDWHEFAVAPKKQALVEQMQALIESELPPKERAERIKALQEEWRLLSRGGQSDDTDLWQAFQQAGNEAFEPCKRYFAEQDREREANLEHRKALCESMAQYLQQYDWDNASWGEVEKTLRLTREAWLSYWPVERKKNKPVQDAFEQVMGALAQKLNAHFEQNRQKKADIVAKAEQLLAMEDTQVAIDSAKLLQAQWREIGRAKQSHEQPLWRQFRKHCDAIFERRKQESDAEKDEREANKTQASALIARLNELAGLSGEAFRNARPEIDEQIEAFRQLGQFPRDDAQRLQQAFRSFEAKLKDAIKREQMASQFDAWKSILATFHTLMACELDATGQDTRALVEAQLDEIRKCPAPIVEKFESRLATPPATTDEQTALEALRRLCVQAEIINERETPEADRQLKLQYQVDQLKHGLGRQNPLLNMDFETFMLHWLDLPALPASLYLPYEQRMLAAWGWQCA